MHTETFLREFGTLAGGPSGIQKLRELVLQLAVRGGLSSSLPSDDNIDQLCSALPGQIEKQIADGIGIKRKEIEYDTAKPPFRIRETWRWVRLDRIASYIQRGKSPTYAERGKIKIISQKCVQWSGFTDTPCRFLDDDAFTKFGPERVVRKGDLLWNSTGTGTIGRINVFDVTPFSEQVFVADSHVTIVRLVNCDPRYIWCFLASPDIQRTLESDASGSTNQVELSNTYVRNTWIPLPPLAEQKRIVTKVDELMALCDELEAQQAKETELTRATAASALHHLIEAKTQEEAVGRWSLLSLCFDELFDDLETISALREVLIELALRGQFTSSVGVSQWPKKVFSEVAEIRSGVTKGRKLLGAEIISVPYLRVANVQRGFVDTKEVKSIEIGAHELDRFSLRRGDVLQIEGGDWDKVGRAALWNGEIDPCVHQNHVFSSRPADGLMPEFVVFWMNSPETKRYFISCSKQTTNLASINKTQLSNTPIVVPPLAEQKRIVAKIDELMASCDQLEKKVREGERLSSELMASIVHALTETDPDGGGAVESVNFAADAPTIAAPEQANMSSPETPGTKSARTASKLKPETRTTPDRALGVETKFQEAVLVAAIVNTFFQAGGEPIGNFRLQKAVYFARRQMGEHVGEMAYLKKAAGPYNPSMKYSGGIAIAKQKNWLREARGRFGFGHVPGAEIGDAGDWIDTYGYAGPARWVAEHCRYKKNEEWETLATVDYAIEHLNTLGIEPDAAQILQYIASDVEWHPKIEKLRLTEMSVATAKLEVQTLFSTERGDQ